MSVEAYRAAARYIEAQIQSEMPKIALTLGSGLNALGDEIDNAVHIPYSDIPGFPTPTVAGHSGKLIIGTLNETPVVCMQGRTHVYEGLEMEKTIFGVRTLWALGVETLILTNAAGSLNADCGPGSLMAINDHINLSGRNPLIGPNIEEIGVRFTDVTTAWTPALLELLKDTAKDIGQPLSEGVYLMVTGPSFETPAEIRAFRTLGADAVGMSTVPECLAARHAGLNVVGISSITNLAAGMSGNELTHDETMEYGALAGKALTTLLKAYLPRLAAL